MNYVILNGKISTLVHGLLILSLPPISKAKKRTQITEIDGVDGDRVQSLGYAAYNKKIEIGLHGRYNVDDVLEYFNSSGIVTFSNEPDKYYKYEIIEQIDLERLLSFKKATVTFHVQPFKYSLVEQLRNKDFNYLTFIEYEEQKLGIELTAHEKRFSVKGRATEETEIYIPIRPVELVIDDYTLTATADGTAPEQATIRLIKDTPSNSNSFAGRSMVLSGNSVSISSRINENKTFNYLWVKIAPNVDVDFNVTIELTGSMKEITVTNIGNIEAKPKMTIYGNGYIVVKLNGEQVFIINLGDEEYIVIDTEEMEAYKGDYLKNRLVTGNYDDFALKVGENKISFFGVSSVNDPQQTVGNVTKFDIVNYSRWC